MPTYISPAMKFSFSNFLGKVIHRTQPCASQAPKTKCLDFKVNSQQSCDTEEKKINSCEAYSDNRLLSRSFGLVVQEKISFKQIFINKLHKTHKRFHILFALKRSSNICP